VEYNLGSYTKYPTDTTLWIALNGIAKYRTFIRFPLTNLPSGAIISQVRLLVNCSQAGGTNHLLDIHPYNSDGQTDPEADSATNAYARCVAGTPYIDDSTALRTTGAKAFTLGGNVIADVGAAKTAVNRFSLGLHEEGDNAAVALLYAFDNGSNYPQLEITYTVPVTVNKGSGLVNTMMDLIVSGKLWSIHKQPKFTPRRLI
jgi:hypothetical protein